MYLIDTSLWIDYFNEQDNPIVSQFENILDEQISFGICSVIYQEILQGAKSKTDFHKLQNYLGSQVFYHPKHPVNTYTAVANLYFTCRRQGITICSTIDCLIAQIALEYDLVLLHNDKDFNQLAQIVPELKQI